MPNRGTVSALVAISLAVFMTTSCSDNTITDGGSNPAINNAPLCAVKDQTVYARGQKCGSTETSGCTTDGACISQAANSNLGTQSGALVELSSEDEVANEDCTGDCGPVGLIYCGQATLDGEPYDGRWTCTHNTTADGRCEMKAKPFACPEAQVCEVDMTLPAPAFARCKLPIECDEDADCVDKDQCTVDSCNAEGQCVNDTTAADTMSCDDGSACTVGDVCMAGTCAGITLECSDSNQCTADSCDTATGCANTAVPDGGECDDADLCTTGDVCMAGVCATTSTVCDDDESCTTDSCDPTTGTCLNVPLADSTVCSDGDLCTTQDNCAAGVCSGTAMNCDDGNECTLDSCNAGTGECMHPSQEDWTMCGAEGWACIAGMCVEASDACDADGATACRNDGGIGYYECMVAEGQTLGTWSLLQACAAPFICVNGSGCL